MEGPLGARFEVGANCRGKARNGNSKAVSGLLRKMYKAAKGVSPVRHQNQASDGQREQEHGAKVAWYKAAIASQQQNRQHVANEIAKLQRSASLPADYNQPAHSRRRVPTPSSRAPQQRRRAKTAAGVRVGRHVSDVTSAPDAWMPLEVCLPHYNTPTTIHSLRTTRSTTLPDDWAVDGCCGAVGKPSAGQFTGCVCTELGLHSSMERRLQQGDGVSPVPSQCEHGATVPVLSNVS